MQELSIAIRISPEEYNFFYSISLDELYAKVSTYFPIRSRFDNYFRQALEAESRQLSLVSPESDDDYFEIILGNSRAVAQVVYIDHLNALQTKAEKQAEAVRGMIRRITEGSLSVEELKKLQIAFLDTPAGQPNN